jgi:hypothetical protein
MQFVNASDNLPHSERIKSTELKCQKEERKDATSQQEMKSKT